MTFYVIFDSTGEPVDMFYPNAYAGSVTIEDFMAFYYKTGGYRWSKVIMDVFDYNVISVEKSF